MAGLKTRLETLEAELKAANEQVYIVWDGLECPVDPDDPDVVVIIMPYRED